MTVKLFVGLTAHDDVFLIAGHTKTTCTRNKARNSANL